MPDEYVSPLSYQGTLIHGLVYRGILDVDPGKSASLSHRPAPRLLVTTTCFAPCSDVLQLDLSQTQSFVMVFINRQTFLCRSTSPENSSLSLRPAVNVEDVDSDHERRGGGGAGEGPSSIPKILTPQDPKLTTLTVPVTPSGGRQR